MPYAQTNYQDKQGINGKYTIAQIGCFITSFCNLLERKGIQVDPPTINAWFRDHGAYIDVDDGVRDDVGYSTVTAYCPNLTVASTGTGTPDTNEAIVKFSYISAKTGHRTTHFCLYLGGGQILDSWDGKVKAISSTRYGNPVGYATYSYKQPEVVKPVSVFTGNTTASSANRYVKLDQPLALMIKKDGVQQWFINFTSYASVKSNGAHNAGEPFTAFGMYKHPLGSNYYMNELDFGNANQDGTPTNPLGYNTVDLTPYVAPVTPTPTPEPVDVPAAPVTVVDTIAPVVPVPSDSNSIPVNVVPSNPESWKASFTVNAQGKYKAQANTVIKDLEGKNPPRQLVKGKVYTIAGEFKGPDGSRYYRTDASVKANNWYGAPTITMKNMSEDDLFISELEDVGASVTDSFNPDELSKVGESGRQKAIKSVASVENFFEKLLKVLTRKK